MRKSFAKNESEHGRGNYRERGRSDLGTDLSHENFGQRQGTEKT